MKTTEEKTFTITLPAQLAEHLDAERRKTADLTYKSAVDHVLHQARCFRLAPNPRSKRLTVDVDLTLLPEKIDGNWSDRIRIGLWAGLISSTTDRLESILAQYIQSDELPEVLEQINHQIIVPLTGHELFSEEEMENT